MKEYHDTVGMWRSEDPWKESVSASYHVGPCDQTLFFGCRLAFTLWAISRTDYPFKKAATQCNILSWDSKGVCGKQNLSDICSHVPITGIFGICLLSHIPTGPFLPVLEPLLSWSPRPSLSTQHSGKLSYTSPPHRGNCICKLNLQAKQGGGGTHL